MAKNKTQIIITPENHDSIKTKVTDNMQKLVQLQMIIRMAAMLMTTFILITNLMLLTNMIVNEASILGSNMLFVMITAPIIHTAAFNYALRENETNINNKKACLNILEQVNNGTLNINYDNKGCIHIDIMTETDNDQEE